MTKKEIMDLSWKIYKDSGTYSFNSTLKEAHDVSKIMKRMQRTFYITINDDILGCFKRKFDVVLQSENGELIINNADITQISDTEFSISAFSKDIYLKR